MTPGVVFLIQVLPFFLVPVFLVVALQRILVLLDVSTLPIWGYMIMLVISIPSYIAFRVRYRMLSNLRDADAMGARLVPPVPGKLIGNIDILPQMIDSLKNGYIGMGVFGLDFDITLLTSQLHAGDGIWENCEELGPVFNIRILWQDSILTTDPNHIKVVLTSFFS
jgi:hypothetical protein